MLASVPCLVNVELRWAASPAGGGVVGRHLCTLQSQASSLRQFCFPPWGPSARWVVVSSAAGGRGGRGCSPYVSSLAPLLSTFAGAPEAQVQPQNLSHAYMKKTHCFPERTCLRLLLAAVRRRDFYKMLCNV